MKTDKPNITLTYDPTKAGGPWFTSNDPTKFPKPGSQTGKIKVAKGDDAEITFTIKTKDINFIKDDAVTGKKPIEISLAPNQTEPDLSTQFTWIGGGTDTLTVTDPNDDQNLTEYYYKLNFDTVPSLDPIIQNGCCQRSDGGGGFQLLSGSGLALVLLAAAAIALIVLRSRRNRAQG